MATSKSGTIFRYLDIKIFISYVPFIVGALRMESVLLFTAFYHWSQSHGSPGKQMGFLDEMVVHELSQYCGQDLYACKMLRPLVTLILVNIIYIYIYKLTRCRSTCFNTILWFWL